MATWCTVNKGFIVPTVDAVELQIEQLLAKYMEALQAHRKGDYEQAKQQYEDLLKNKLVKKSLVDLEQSTTSTSKQEGPALFTVRFIVLKNYASLLRDQFKSDPTKADLAEVAIQNYLQALSVDSTDLSLWYEAGNLCQQLRRWRLARLAYENGICSATDRSGTDNSNSSIVDRVGKLIQKGDFSPMQWKCVQNLCEVLFELGDHSTCSYYIDIVLQANPDWKKGFEIQEGIHSANKPDDMKSIRSPFNDDECYVAETIGIEVDEPQWFAILKALMKQYKEVNAIDLTDGQSDMDSSMETVKQPTSDRLLNTAFHSQPIHITFREAEETGPSTALADYNPASSIPQVQNEQDAKLQEPAAEKTVVDTTMEPQEIIDLDPLTDTMDEDTQKSTKELNSQMDLMSLKRKRSNEVDEEEGTQIENGEDNGEGEEAEEKRTSLRTFKRKKEKMANEETSRRKMLEEEKDFLNKVESFYGKIRYKSAPLHVDTQLRDAGDSFPCFWSWFDNKVSELDSSYCWDIRPINTSSHGGKGNTAESRKLLLFTLSYPKAALDQNNNSNCSEKVSIKLFAQELNENNSGITDALCKSILSLVKSNLNTEELYPMPDKLLDLVTNTIIMLELNFVNMLAMDQCLSQTERLKVTVRISEYMVDRLIRNTMLLDEEAGLRASSTNNRKRSSTTARRKLQEMLLEHCELWASFVSQYLCVLSPDCVPRDVFVENDSKWNISSADQLEMNLRYCFVRAKLAQCKYNIEDAYKWFSKSKSTLNELNKLSTDSIELNVHSLYDSFINMETINKKIELFNTARLYIEAERKMAQSDFEGAIKDIECVVEPLLNGDQLNETEENTQMVDLLSDAYCKTDNYAEAWRCGTHVFSNLIQQLLSYGNQQTAPEHRLTKDLDVQFLDCVRKINHVLDKLIMLQCTKDYREFFGKANKKLLDQLACLLRMTTYYMFRHPDFIPLVNNFTEPDIPQHRPSKKTKASIFNNVIVKAWVCQSYLVQAMFAHTEEALTENGDILKTWAEVIQELHDELGEREICGASDGILLLHLLNTLIKADDMSFRRDIYQCYHCLYGVHLAAETDAIEEHHCIHRLMDQKAAEPLFTMIANAAIDKLRSGLLLKADLKDVIDTVSEHFDDLPKSYHPLIKHNLNTIEKYLSSGIRLYPSFNDLLRSSIIPTTEISPEKTNTSIVFFRIFWIRGKTLRVQINNRPKGTGADKNLNDLEVAVEKFRTHIMLNPNDVDGWLELATCYQLLAEEELNWSASNIDIRKDYICDIQRRAFHAYIRGIYLDKLSSPKSTVRHSFFASFGNLLYSMASLPMRMEAFRLQDTRMVKDSNGAYTKIANTPPSSTAIYKLAYLMYTNALKYPAPEQWRSYYMAGKCLGKLKRPAKDVVLYYLRAIKETSYNKRERREPILEPVYTFYSALLKYLLHGDLSPQFGMKVISEEKKVSYIAASKREPEQRILQPQPQATNSGPTVIDLTESDGASEQDEDTEVDTPVDMITVYDTILMRLNDIRVYDIKGWHHRPLYRISWMYYHIYHDAEKAKTELIKFFNFKEKVRNFINIWKTSFELPGKHYEYNNKYTLFLIKLATETNDSHTLKQLYKKLRRAQSIIVNEASTFYTACIAYLDVLDRRLAETHFADTILKIIIRSKMGKEQFKKMVLARKEKIAEDNSEAMQQLRKDLQDLAELRRNIQGYLTGENATIAQDRLHTSIQLVFGTMLFGGTANNHLLRQIQLDDSEGTNGASSERELSDVLLYEGRTLMQDLPFSS